MTRPSLAAVAAWMRERWPNVPLEADSTVLLFGVEGGWRLFVWDDGEVTLEHMRRTRGEACWFALEDLEPRCEGVATRMAGKTDAVPA